MNCVPVITRDRCLPSTLSGGRERCPGECLRLRLRVPSLCLSVCLSVVCRLVSVHGVTLQHPGMERSSTRLSALSLSAPLQGLISRSAKSSQIRAEHGGITAQFNTHVSGFWRRLPI